jgi:alkylated DNA repair dioxygenase AlkB
MASAAADESMALRLREPAAQSTRLEFVRQGSFVHVPDFLPPEVTARLVGAVAQVTAAVNRNYLPGHKQGGSVSRHVIDRLVPFVADLYRSPALLAWLGAVAGEPLQLSPQSDPHAYALYFYTRPGDHIGWHYDTSYYVGRRYTVLIGVVENSSCRLDYELHTREPAATVVPGSLKLAPGSLCFFNGDKLRHRITPLAEGEMRVSLTFEYVTDPRMHPWRRLISNMKDAFGYFGFRQVFGAATRGGRGGRA